MVSYACGSRQDRIDELELEVEFLEEVYQAARKVLRNKGVDALLFKSALFDLDVAVENAKLYYALGQEDTEEE